ncbi:Wings apart-like protein [Penicillium bovifimosum]|uniref:Wings apart-like protein n=1 Tax=Penicillium bovifimosum TaxID=126998 RepID=A0A9W9HCF6_9EURO|nr:Wings apart-like protein [Penicillium bovifimosum]KAJ5144133.1 Wings apart-like protein [Penicillium bovifimosum]
MENTNPRNRRLVTYGSAAKGQPRANTEKPMRSSTAKSSPKDVPLPSSSRPSRPPHARLQRDKNGVEPQPGSVDMAIPCAPPSKSTTELNVFDIPSSDDEQMSMVRRKRRRYSPDGSTAVLATRPAEKPSTIVNGEGSASPKLKTKKVPGDRNPSARKREAHKAISSAKPPSYPRAGRSGRSQAKIFSLNQELEASTDKSPGEAKPMRESSPEASLPSTPKATVTPGRRRLIDSLGITEDRVESSPETPTSQPSRNPVIPDRPFSDVAVNEGPVNSQVQDTPASVPSHLQGSRTTYARQRSFLDDMMLEDLPENNTPSGPSHRSQSVQRQLNYEATSNARLIVPNEDINGEESVRSIHELRQAGGNARYRGAVESIFEDIEDVQNSLTGRCNAFLQLCGKLLDPGLKRRFVECNFDKRLVDCLSMKLEVVPMILAFSAYALGSSDGLMSYVLATSAWPKLLDASPMLLGMQEEISVVTRAKTSGLSRPLQKAIQNIVPQLAEMLFPGTTMSKLSPCALALYCLRSTIATMQTKGESPSLSTTVLQTLVQILVSESQRCVSLGKINILSSQTLSMGFSVLEACTASTEPLINEHRDLLNPLSELHNLLSLELDTLSPIKALYIRLILNITNSNPSLCDRFANLEMIGGLVDIVSANFGDLTEDALGQANNSLDNVILALGALINLTEQSEISRSTFRHSAGAGKTFLGRLLQLFMTHVDSISTAHSVLEVHHNVAVGYLAVLLLILSLDPETRSKIKKSLAPKGLTAVISTVDEFLQYHLKIEHEIPAQGQGQPATGFLSRLQELVTQIRLVEQ